MHFPRGPGSALTVWLGDASQGPGTASDTYWALSNFMLNEQIHEWMGWTWRPTSPWKGQTTVVLLKRKLKCSVQFIQLEPYNRSALAQTGKPGLTKHLGKIDPWADQFPPASAVLLSAGFHLPIQFHVGVQNHYIFGGCLGTWSCSLCFYLAEFLIHNFQEQWRPCWVAHTYQAPTGPGIKIFTRWFSLARSCTPHFSLGMQKHESPGHHREYQRPFLCGFVPAALSRQAVPSNKEVFQAVLLWSQADSFLGKAYNTEKMTAELGTCL